MPEEADKQAAYQLVLDDLRAKKHRIIEEISAKYDAAIAAIEASLSDALPNGSPESTVTAQGNSELRVSLGEFHGMPNTAAARAVLQKTARQPLSTHKILEYIEKSGRKLEGKNPVGTLYSSLARNPDFELVAPNTWGLAEWYGKRRKKSLAQRVEDKLAQGPMSIDEATRQAESEEEAEEESAAQ